MKTKGGGEAVGATGGMATAKPGERPGAIAAREIAAWLDTHELPRTVILSAFSAESAITLRRALSDLGRPDLTGA